MCPTMICSVVDPDPALNFPRSGSRSRQKFRVHADPDPTHVIQVYLENVNKTTLNSIIKKNLSTIFHFLFHTSTVLHKVQNSKRNNIFSYLLFIFCWIRIRNNNSGSRQKFLINADPDPQHCLFGSKSKPVHS